MNEGIEQWERERMIKSGQLIPAGPEAKEANEARRKRWVAEQKKKLSKLGIVRPELP